MIENPKLNKMMEQLRERAGGLTVKDINFTMPPGFHVNQVGIVFALELIPVLTTEGLTVVESPDDKRDLAYAQSIGMTAEQWLQMRDYWFKNGG